MPSKGEPKRRQHIRRNARIKLEVVTHYGNGKAACLRCGFEDVRALCIDHINGYGIEHRRSISPSHEVSGSNFYAWLRREGYPLGFQTLCFNCNQIKKMENGENRYRRKDAPRLL